MYLFAQWEKDGIITSRTGQKSKISEPCERTLQYSSIPRKCYHNCTVGGRTGQTRMISGTGNCVGLPRDVRTLFLRFGRTLFHCRTAAMHGLAVGVYAPLIARLGNSRFIQGADNGAEILRGMNSPTVWLWKMRPAVYAVCCYRRLQRRSLE